MSSPFADQLAAVRTLIAGLAPLSGQGNNIQDGTAQWFIQGPTSGGWLANAFVDATFPLPSIKVGNNVWVAGGGGTTGGTMPAELSASNPPPGTTVVDNEVLWFIATKWFADWTVTAGGNSTNFCLANGQVYECVVSGKTGPGFTAVPGDQPIEHEPGVLKRWFEVVADGSPALTEPYMAGRTRRATRKFAVTILYDTDHNIALADEIVAQDDDLIIGNIELPTGFATNVMQVTTVSGSMAKSGEFWRRTITFECEYVHNF